VAALCRTLPPSASEAAPRADSLRNALRLIDDDAPLCREPPSRNVPFGVFISPCNLLFVVQDITRRSFLEEEIGPFCQGRSHFDDERLRI